MMRGFSLVEAMAALGIAALTGSLAVAAFQTGVVQVGAGDREWTAFTLAQQQLELLAAVPKSSTLLEDRTADTAAAPGSRADATCASGVDGGGGGRVDALGQADSAGLFEMCWKVTDDHPSGSLKNVRAIATFPGDRGERKSVLLQVLR